MEQANGRAVLVVGAIMVDVVCDLERLPSSGEGLVAQSVQATVGGCAYNAANVIRQLGAPFHLLAPVGSGIFAGFAERELAARNMSGLHVAPGSQHYDSGGCVCLVEPNGERTMITLPGIDRHFERSWFDHVRDEAAAGWFGSGIACGYEVDGAGGDAIIGFFEEHPGIQLWYAPGPRIEHVGERKTARINALRPIWHLNDQEARAYTGHHALEAAGFALARACGNAVVVTAGADGAHVFEDGRHLHVPADPTEPVNTIGAGDTHLGALAAARAAGLSWNDALTIANRAAAAVCAEPGGTIPDETFARLGLRL